MRYIDEKYNTCYNNKMSERMPFYGQAEQVLLEDAPVKIKDLPTPYYVDNIHDKQPIPAAVIGNPDAQNIVVVSNPMFTDTMSDHYLVRLAGDQRVLGDDYQILAVNGYDPQAAFTAKERGRIANGDLSPVTERIFRVIEHKAPRHDQNVLTMGPSLGADTSVQLAHESLFNEGRGIVPIAAVGAHEPARMVNRRILVVQDFMKSGDDLFKNIIYSESEALLQAWDLDPTVHRVETQMQFRKEKKKFDDKVAKDVMKYVLSAPLANFAMMRGFGTDRTYQQIRQIVRVGRIPVSIVRAENSLVCPQQKFEKLKYETMPCGNISFTEIPDADHSIFDDPIVSAASALGVASLLNR